MRRLIVGFGALLVALVMAGQAQAGGAVGARSRPLVRHLTLKASSIQHRAARGRTAIASMHTAVEEMGGGAAFNNRLYVAGGYTNISTLATYGFVQIYNPANNTWVTDTQAGHGLAVGGTGSAGQPISGDAAVCTDGTNMYIINGSDGQTAQGQDVFSAMQVYNPTTGLTLKAAPYVTTTSNLYFSLDSGCAVMGGKVFLFGGLGATVNTPTFALQKTTLVYTPSSNTWAVYSHTMLEGSYLFAYSNNTAAAVAAGGIDNLTNNHTSNIAELLVPSKGWIRLHNLPTVAGASAAGMIGAGSAMAGGKIMIYGGGGPTTTANQFVLNAATYSCPLSASCVGTTGSWTNASMNLTTARWFFGDGQIGGTLYAAGGGTATTNPTASAEKLP